MGTRHSLLAKLVDQPITFPPQRMGHVSSLALHEGNKKSCIQSVVDKLGS